jgi:hypothetical protein
MGIDIHAPQVAQPRAFKSHLPWSEIPKGGRYIVVLRDPVDAMVSLYRFFDGWTFESGAIPLPEFAESYLDRNEPDSYWGHLSSWWAQRERPDVFLVCYEYMKRDLAGTVERVADFIDPAISRETLAVATAQASFDFMKRHERQFDDHLLRQARDAACGLPPDGHSSKVSKGESGSGKAMVPDEIRQKFTLRWQEAMKEFGLASYDDLYRQLHPEG